ncbi:MAG: hypothetical protein FWC41_11630 [Firmicutes bacterium]|nr:hypothetical protein [Bacillota bacterium]
MKKVYTNKGVVEQFENGVVGVYNSGETMSTGDRISPFAKADARIKAIASYCVKRNLDFTILYSYSTVVAINVNGFTTKKNGYIYSQTTGRQTSLIRSQCTLSEINVRDIAVELCNKETRKTWKSYNNTVMVWAQQGENQEKCKKVLAEKQEKEIAYIIEQIEKTFEK